jgi:hypothetical protein
VDEFAEAGEVGAGMGMFLGGEDAATSVGEGAVGAAEALADGGRCDVGEEFAAEGHGYLAWPCGFAVAARAPSKGGRDAVEMGDGVDDGVEGGVIGGKRGRIKIKIKIRIKIGRFGGFHRILGFLV